jgi:DNA-binding response OmpR family regulator
MGSTEQITAGRAPRALRVLVVEHDVLVRTLVAAYLRECGYAVVEARNGEEAIAILRADLPVDVVFAEVGLPGEIDGFGLAQWVRRERPGIKVLLTSGANRTANVAGELCGQGPVMAKPYDHAELARRIRSLVPR